MDEETKKLMEQALEHADPELIEKFGNPLDENDPRIWTPTKRIEQGVSLEDQVKYLGLDVEAQSIMLGDLLKRYASLQETVMELTKAHLLEKLKTDPEGAIQDVLRMSGLGGHDKGSYGPLENDPNSPVRYAGSTKGIQPDQMVDTPNGMIRADEIPGYQNDPNWKPSPDWVDANCMCPEHVRTREAQAKYDPFNINPDDDGRGGMYL
jgi:hypothetical protein